MSVFSDLFNLDATGTSLPSDTSSTPSHWLGSNSFVIDNAQGAHGNAGSGLSVTGGTNTATVECNVDADFIYWSGDAFASTLFDGIGIASQNNVSTQFVQCYYLQINSDQLSLYVQIAAGNFLGDSVAVSLTTGGGSSATYHATLTVRINPTTSTSQDIAVYITNNAGQYLNHSGAFQSGQVACLTSTVASPNTLPLGSGCLLHFSFLTSNTTGVHFKNFVVSNAISPLTPGVATFNGATNTSISMSATASAGGTTPYSYQWLRSTSATGTFSNVSGQTSLSMTDTTPTPGIYYWDKLQTTDSASPTPAVVYTNAVPARTWQKPKVWGFLGDSITAGANTSAFIEHFQELEYFELDTVGANEGVPGSTTTEWISGSTNMNNALSAFSSDSVTDVHVQLGTNDAVNLSSTYLSDLTSALGALTAAGYRVWISYPLYASAFSDAQNGWLKDTAQPIIDSLVDNVHIWHASKLTFDYFATHASLLTDGIHPTSQGYINMAELWAMGIWDSENPGGGSLLVNPGMSGGMRG